MQDFLSSGRINIGFIRVIKKLLKPPSLNLPIHLPIFLLHIPNPSLERRILLLQRIDPLLKLIILSPDNILRRHGFGKMFNII